MKILTQEEELTAAEKCLMRVSFNTVNDNDNALQLIVLLCLQKYLSLFSPHIHYLF